MTPTLLDDTAISTSQTVECILLLADFSVTLHETDTSTSETVVPADTQVTPAKLYYDDAFEQILEKLSRADPLPQSFVPGPGTTVTEDALRWRFTQLQQSGPDFIVARQPGGVGAPFYIGLQRSCHEGQTTDPAPERSIGAILRPILDRLDEFGRLEQGWDSYGATAICPTAITAARTLLYRVADRLGTRALPYTVAPLASGAVQLEWRGPCDVIEVEVGPHGDYSYLHIRGEGASRNFEERDQASLSEVLSRVVQVVVA